MGSTVAVVLNFNDAEATLGCVDTISGAAGIDHTVVVDNGSDGDDRGKLTQGLELRTGVSLIASSENVGFGAGVNLGIDNALSRGADSILVLNNDTLVTGDAVRRLRVALESDPKVAIAVPVVTTGDVDRLWAAGGHVNARYLTVRHLMAGLPRDNAMIDRDVTFAPGAAFLIRSEIVRNIGGFVEKFFLYMEDVELSLRVTEAGFRIRLVSDAHVWHAVQGGRQSRGTSSVFFRARNTLWLARFRGSGWRTAPIALITSIRLIRTVQRKSGHSPRAFFAGLRRLVRGLLAGCACGEPRGGLTPRQFGEG